MTRLYRSKTNRKVAGLCAGVGEMLDVDPTIVRLVTVLLLFITGIIPLLLTYIIAWWIVPDKPQDTARADHHV